MKLMLNDTRPRWCCANEIKLEISYGITASAGEFHPPPINITHLSSVECKLQTVSKIYAEKLCVSLGIRNVMLDRKSYPKPILCFPLQSHSRRFAEMALWIRVRNVIVGGRRIAKTVAVSPCLVIPAKISHRAH